MIHWYYQLYGSELLLTLNTKIKKKEKDLKPKSELKIPFTTILQLDGIIDLNLKCRPQQIDEPKTDYLFEYFKNTWSKRPSNPLTRSELFYANIDRIKATHKMKYVNLQTFNSWVNKHDADIFIKEQLEDGFKLYEDFKEKIRFEHLIYISKPLTHKYKFNEILTRNHFITVDTIYNSLNPTLLMLEEFERLKNKPEIKTK